MDILKKISKHNPIPEKLSYDSFFGIELTLLVSVTSFKSLCEKGN